MIELAEQWLGEHRSGELRRESAAARAERIIAEELGRRGWGQAELDRRRKNEPEKLALAARLKRETMLPVKDIALRVGLGSSKSAGAKLRLWMQSDNNPQVAADVMAEQKGVA